MKQEVLKAFDLPWLPVVAMILFVTCFVLYTWWTFRAANRTHFDSIAKIPLDEKDVV